MIDWYKLLFDYRDFKTESQISHFICQFFRKSWYGDEKFELIYKTKRQKWYITQYKNTMLIILDDRKNNNLEIIKHIIENGNKKLEEHTW